MRSVKQMFRKGDLQAEILEPLDGEQRVVRVRLEVTQLDLDVELGLLQT